jgi:hypothetical protein
MIDVLGFKANKNIINPQNMFTYDADVSKPFPQNIHPRRRENIIDVLGFKTNRNTIIL